MTQKPNQKRVLVAPSKKREKKGTGFNPAALPVEQRGSFLAQRHTATIQRLQRELDKCYAKDEHGRRILVKAREAGEIMKIIKRIQEFRESE